MRFRVGDIVRIKEGTFRETGESSWQNGSPAKIMAVGNAKTLPYVAVLDWDPQKTKRCYGDDCLEPYKVWAVCGECGRDFHSDLTDYLCESCRSSLMAFCES